MEHVVLDVKKRAEKESLYLEKYLWLKNGWYIIRKLIVEIFLLVCRFLLFVRNYDHSQS